MVILIETPESQKKQSLSKQDIADILSFDGPVEEALVTLNITRTQWNYVRQHYDPVTLKLTYREDMDTLYYE